MAYHNELREMREAVERRKHAQFVPGEYGVDSRKVLEGIRDGIDAALENEGAKALWKLGLDDEGRPEVWVVIKSEAGIHYVGNLSFTCPPRPPEDCEE